MKSISLFFRTCAVVALACCFCGCHGDKDKNTADHLTINFGHFPNISHVQALVAHHLSRTGVGWYEERLSRELGKPVKINWYTYNAGPGAMEALFARSIDLTYVGPSPAINAFVKSSGSEVRIISGSAEGGAALVVRGDSPLKAPLDFKGKVVATPQLGNTQDVSCRAWFADAGMQVTQSGGDVKILPTANPEQLSLFRMGKLDGVWTVEPWVSRLELEAGGKVLVDERAALVTVLASSSSFMSENPAVIAAVVKAHRELTEWIKSHPDEAQKIVVDEMGELTHSKIDPELVKNAWDRITLTADLDLLKLQTFVKNAHRAGFMKTIPDVNGMVQVPSAESKK
ncbi:MAG: ABC transporter substrate-binding protein [Akkermansia sp.]